MKILDWFLVGLFRLLIKNNRVGKIHGTRVDGSVQPMIIGGDWRSLEIDDDFISLDLSGLDKAVKLESVIYSGSYLDNITLPNYSDCPNLCILKLRLQSQCDLSLLSQWRDNDFILGIDIAEEPELSSLESTDLSFLELRLMNYISNPLKSLGSRFIIRALNIVVTESGPLHLENLPMSLNSLSISGPVSDVDLALLEDLTSLTSLSFNGLRMPDHAIADFEDTNWYFKNKAYAKQLRLPTVVAQRLRHFSLKNCVYLDFFAYPFAGANVLETIKFTNSDWASMHLDSLCDIPSLKLVELDANKCVYIDHMKEEQDIISPGVRDIFVRSSFESY